MAEIERPRVLKAIVNLYVFDTGEVGIRYENLGPVQFIRLLLKTAEQFVMDRFDPKQIVSAEETPPPAEPPTNGGNPG